MAPSNLLARRTNDGCLYATTPIDRIWHEVIGLFYLDMAPRNDRQQTRRAASITRMVSAGFAHHEAGRLDQAEALYRKALE